MILVLTPLAAEESALHAALGEPLRVQQVKQARVTHFSAGLATAVGGHGKVAFALTAQLLIEALQPRLLVCAGACGLLTDSAANLDVVAATQTIEHDYSLQFVKRPLPSFAGHAPTLAYLRNLAPFAKFKLHFAAIASGDEDVIERVRAEEIHRQTGAHVVAWEGAGGARAAAFCSVPFLELRVITDQADDQAVLHFQKNLKLGMPNVAAVLRTLN